MKTTEFLFHFYLVWPLFFKKNACVSLIWRLILFKFYLYSTCWLVTTEKKKKNHSGWWKQSQTSLFYRLTQLCLVCLFGHGQIFEVAFRQAQTKKNVVWFEPCLLAAWNFNRLILLRSYSLMLVGKTPVTVLQLVFKSCNRKLLLVKCLARSLEWKNPHLHHSISTLPQTSVSAVEWPGDVWKITAHNQYPNTQCVLLILYYWCLYQ